MHSRGFVLFLLCLLGSARRSILSNSSHLDAQQQDNIVADGLDVSAEATQAWIPGVIKTDLFPRAHRHMGALRRTTNTHNRAATSLRFGLDRRTAAIAMLSDDVPAANPDVLLLAALEELQAKHLSEARALYAQAASAYGELKGGPSAEQSELLALVGVRLDAAAAPGISASSEPRASPTSKEQLAARTEAKLDGDNIMMEAVQVFGNKSDAERFQKSFALLEQARARYRAAGSDVERDRDGVLGNLYAAVRAESERAERVKKLVRLKRQLELVKQKRKAQSLGLDPDTVESAMAVAAANHSTDSSAVVDGGAVDDGQAMTGGILETWRRENVDGESQEMEWLQREIDELEDSL